MNRILLYRMLFSAVMAVLSTAFPGNVQAGCGRHADKCNSCTTCCPKCEYECKLKAAQVDVEKSCFEVESKVICVPRVVFPWQKKASCGACDSCDGRGCSSCFHNGAQIRTIRVLKTKKYKCPACEYVWSPEKKSCVGGYCDAFVEPHVARAQEQPATLPATAQAPMSELERVEVGTPWNIDSAVQPSPLNMSRASSPAHQ